MKNSIKYFFHVKIIKIFEIPSKKTGCAKKKIIFYVYFFREKNDTEKRYRKKNQVH